MQESNKTLSDYFQVLRRRKVMLLHTMGWLFAVGAVLAFSLPSVYRSSATILVEQQGVPDRLVQSSIGNYADQRIQVISQRLMTSANLRKIIEKYGLYGKQGDNTLDAEIYERLRDDIALQTVSADVMDPNSGKSNKATIAFTLSYENQSPELAHSVAKELVGLFLDENVKASTEQAGQTSDFLSEEASKIGLHISNMERRLAEFKEHNAGSLPELSELNLQLTERVNREITDIRRQIRSMDERRVYLRSQLAQMSPVATVVSASGERVLGPAERLKILEAQLARASAVYAPEHPDVIRLQSEVHVLRTELGIPVDVSEMKLQLKSLRAELVTLEDRYDEGHPDLEKIKNEVLALEKGIKSANQQPRKQKARPAADNGAYIQVQAQLEATNTDLRYLKKQEGELKAKLEEYERRLTATPGVEREYRALSREYESALARYRKVTATQGEAEMSENWERGLVGERFTLIEPPSIPEKAIKPNRPSILFLGFVVSFVGGIGSVAVRESLDRRIRGAKGVNQLMGRMPVGIIPDIAGLDAKTLEGRILDSQQRAIPESDGVIKFTRTAVVDSNVDILKENHVISSLEPGPVADAYRMFRTKVLQAMKSNNWNTLAVTSTRPEEGKTLTAINLAISLAMDVNHTVLLVDLDLRRPTVHRFFGHQPEKGISDYLCSDVGVEELLFSPSVERLVILPGREAILNSSEMLSSPKLVGLIQELKSRYESRLIIFDMPPILVSDDVLVLSPHVDATLLVIEDNMTQIDDLVRATELLGKDKLFGTVLNKAEITKQTYYYY